MKGGRPTRTLGEVLTVQNGYAFDSKAFNASEGMPLIRIRDLKIGTGTETRFIGDYDEKYVVKAGDLLIGMDGEFVCFEWKGSPALLNQRVCRLQGFSSDLLPRFLFYGVNSHLKSIEDVTGYATVKHISSKQILNIEFPLPPFPEQQRIVGILDEAFEGIATANTNAEKNLQNAHALFESHLNSVFTQHGPEWQIKKLGEVCSYLNRGISPRYIEVGGICVLNQKCVRNHLVSYEPSRRHDEKAKKVGRDRLIQAGDVLVNSTGTGTLGRVAQLRENPQEPTTVDSHVTIVRPTPRKFFTEFFGYMLIFIENAIKEAGEGCGGQTELARSVLAEKFSVHYPVSLKEQERHVAKLDTLSAETQRLATLYKCKLAALESLKKSLLNQAFIGEL
jgi:type I restriction enzyme S subunit